MNSPLLELRLIFEKRLRTAQNLGEEAKARAYREAYDLARKKLASGLGEEAEAAGDGAAAPGGGAGAMPDAPEGT